MMNLPESMESKMTREQEFNVTKYIAEQSYSPDPTPYNLYLGLFQKIPNVVYLNHINIKKALEKFLESFGSKIIDRVYSHGTFKEGLKMTSKLRKMNLFLEPNTMVHFNNQDDLVIVYYKSDTSDVIENYIEVIRGAEKKFNKKAYLSILRSTSEGIQPKRVKIEKMKIDYEKYYNDDLLSVHEVLVEKLNEKNQKGVVLLHGEPGTGKTTYIKSLIPLIKKDVLFIPSKMAIDLTSPDFINLLLDNRNSILIIEDAEEILLKRTGVNSSAVSALLNLADGLISDILNIQIICTFNTELRNIDSAILRKGRMIARYQFGKLNKQKSQNLLDALGSKNIATGDMSHAEIFNEMNNDFSEGFEKVLGFINNK